MFKFLIPVAAVAAVAAAYVVTQKRKIEWHGGVKSDIISGEGSVKAED